MDTHDPKKKAKARYFVLIGTIAGLFIGFIIFLFCYFRAQHSGFGQMVASIISFIISILLGILGGISGFLYFGYSKHHEEDASIDYIIPPDMR